MSLITPKTPLELDLASKDITSLQEQIEWHLRIASLLVGLAVGVLSLVAMTRKMRRR